MSAGTASEAAGRPLARLSVGLSFLVACFEGADLQAPGLVAPRLAAELHLAASQLGAFFSAGTLGLFVGALAGGRLADRWGRKTLLLASVFLFGVFTLATAASGSYRQLLLLRSLTGLGLGGALPNLLALCSENAPPARRRRAVGMMYAGLPLGGALASLVMLSSFAGSGWRFLFVLGGAAPLLCLPLLWRLLPESVAFVPSTAGRVPVAGRVPAAGRASLGRAISGSRLAPSLLLWVSFFATLVVFYLLLNWLPSLLMSRGLSRPDAALVQTVFNLAGACGALAAGYFMDGRWRLATAACAYTGSLAALGGLAASPPGLGAAAALGALVGLFMMATQSVLYATAPPLYPAGLRGTGVGAAVAVGRLGAVAGPLLAGSLIGHRQGPDRLLLVILPIVALAGLLACLLIARQGSDA